MSVGLVIVLIVGLIVVAFVMAISRKNAKIRMQGGMRKKYSTLIDLIQEAYPEGKVHKELGDSILIIAQASTALIMFDIQATFQDKLIITWKARLPSGATIKNKWRYHWEDDQREIFEQMTLDVARMFGLMK